MADEEILIPIPRVNPITFNTYADTYMTTKSIISGAVAYEIPDAYSTGLKGFIHMPFACTLTAYSLLADVSGNLVVDIWKDIFANFPPTVADTITAAAKPTLAAAQGVQSSILTGWTTSIAAGDILAFNIDSTATISKAILTLFFNRVI
jgi:hypothetical protein